MTGVDTVWGLDTGRQGEFMQVLTLGQSLGLAFERISLSPENLPGAALPATPPRLILSFGRAARAALRLADGCVAAGHPRPLLVHLGTPGQTPSHAFDLIVPMPQDDYPTAPNVVFMRLPLNGAALDAAVLPPPGAAGECIVIIGGPSRHFRMTRASILPLIAFAARLAAANGEALRFVTSPRTPPAVLDALRAARAENGFTLDEYGAIPFAATLRSGARFVVTADSASMLAEACRTGAPVWLFPLPRRVSLSSVLQHGTDRCLGNGFRHRLVRRGWVGGGTDFGRWHRRLEAQHYIFRAGMLSPEALRRIPTGIRSDTDLGNCRARILSLLDRQ